MKMLSIRPSRLTRNVGWLIAFLILLTGCYDKALVNPSLPPPITMNLGYFGLIAPYSWMVKEFQNQSQISASDLQALTNADNSPEKGIIVRMNESNVKCSVIGYSGNEVKVFDSLEFVFNFYTNLDKEVFVTGKNGKNGLDATDGFSSDSNFNNCDIGAEFLIPIKFSDKGIQNNDTLEINPKADTINYIYHSIYTGNRMSSKLIVN